MSQDNTPASAEDLAAAIEELTQYRERLVTEMTDTAKKAKVKKSKMMGVLQPELEKIDNALEALKTQHASSAN
ncbi:hypothetical protein Lepto7376_4082 [[Leptolyngbya] sp. PCC 7376]|uniref:hypothetical protein n=1 Tax=[Leptolyngbya] sp. PCC 7376 TaxID=111781 RepID=UPI00029EF4F1|nr:hypothetical protein [[Leptolyngbya] sp. PCC 7376]AFY40211.1 hypothetical protein Lepto7376_4082 [[Leptolyngbya] sp. PCC 7376]